MTNIIKHRGVVENISGNHIRVRITQASACAACHAKGYCSSSDSKEKIVDVVHPGGAFTVGEEVMIYGTTSMGMQAVFLAFVLPFLILISVLFILMKTTQNDELLSAAGALAALVPYYVLIYLFRNRLKKNFTFTIKPTNS